MKEIELLVTLNHPNIIKLYEIWETDNKCYLVMEYCKGGELFDYIIKHERMSEAIAANIMKRLLSGLHYLHSNNIAHRDIKPENLMLKNPEDITSIKFIDFGLGKNF